MTETQKLPPFVQEYRTDGAVLWMNSGSTIRFTIVHNYIKTQVPAEDILKLYVAGFWIVEGYLYRHEIDSEQYPTLAYYLENRGSLDIASLWREWSQLIDPQELELLNHAYSETRRHALETMAELPLEEKKSE